MLEVRDLACVRGERRLFSDLNFTLKPGGLLQVQGENGRGKTSLLRIVCGLLQPVAGGVRWEGVPTDELGEEYRARLLYLGHHEALKEELTPLENLRVSSALAGGRIDEADAVAALRRLGLRGREHLPVRVLSQGQRRRAALARLLVSDAPLWILDEPLAALDARAVGLIEEILGEHVARGGMVLFTTHQPLRVQGVTPQALVLE